MHVSQAPIASPLEGTGRFRLTTGDMSFVRRPTTRSRPARARPDLGGEYARTATHALGIPTMLVGGVSGLSFKTDTLAGQFAVERQLAHYYGVDAEFDIQLIYGYGSDADRSQWIVSQNIRDTFCRMPDWSIRGIPDRSGMRQAPHQLYLGASRRRVPERFYRLCRPST